MNYETYFDEFINEPQQTKLLNLDVYEGSLEGQKIDGRFEVKALLDPEQSQSVFHCFDHATKLPCVIKISKTFNGMSDEQGMISFLGPELAPQVVHSG